MMTTLNVKQHLVESLRIYSKEASDDDVDQISYINPHKYEEARPRWTIESMMNKKMYFFNFKVDKEMKGESLSRSAFEWSKYYKV